MLEWIIHNIATILISLVLAGGVAAIVIGMLKDKKKGKSSCGGNCGCCPMGGSCHKK